MVRALACLLLFCMTASLHATSSERVALAGQICVAAEEQAKINNIDPSFFARLLWRESLFDPNVVSYKGAQGIAQFMPETAKKRGLVDPFEPLSAVRASASFLADLKKQFGNLGLAAAAYNAGEKRVSDWQAGRGGMPDETRDYVAFITGKGIEFWKTAGAEFGVPAIGPASDFSTNCQALALRKGALLGTHVASAPRQPYGALLAANFNENMAMAMFRRLKLRFPDQFANQQPMIIRRLDRSRGRRRMVFVMLGAKSFGEAENTCRTLQGMGAPCVPRKS